MSHSHAASDDIDGKGESFSLEARVSKLASRADGELLLEADDDRPVLPSRNGKCLEPFHRPFHDWVHHDEVCCSEPTIIELRQMGSAPPHRT